MTQVPVGNELIRSLTKHEQEPVEASVTGEIPSWVSGTMYRNGPGRFEYGEKSHNHLFDGAACIHKYKIEEGKVQYSNKFLETKTYNAAINDNVLYPGFGSIDLCNYVFGRLKLLYQGRPPINDNTNVNIMPYANQQLYALTEWNYLTKVDPSNLNTVEMLRISKYVDKVASTFAHPHVLEDGSWITMGRTSKGIVPNYQFIRFKVNPDVNEKTNMCEQGELIGSIPSSHTGGLAYFHSFGLTKNYIIFLEQGLKIDGKRMITNVLFNRPAADLFVNDTTFKTRIHLMNRETGELVKTKFVTDPLFAFHHINAYETENGDIISDICAYDANFFDIKNITREKYISEQLFNTPASKSIARRITIPLGKYLTENPDTDVHCEIRDINSEASFELPVINYSANNTKPYKFTYGTNFYKLPHAIVKLNVETGEAIERVFDKNDEKFLPTEPVFVPRPDSSEEDEGVLLVMVLSTKRDFLAVLDAKDLKELARAEVPEDVLGSLTFHGFFADKENYPKLNV